MTNKQKLHEAVAILKQAERSVLIALKTMPMNDRRNPAVSIRFKMIAMDIEALWQSTATFAKDEK